MKMPKFGKRRVAAFAVPMIIAFAVACGSTAATVATDKSSNVPPPIGIVNATTTETPAAAPLALEAPAPANAPEVVAAVQDLDADTIVAAQGQVLGDIYDKFLPSVVQIQTRTRVEGQRGGFGQAPGSFSQAEGSGFVWGDNGYIVTNQHVIAGADDVFVTFADGTEVDAEVIGSDADSDLAVLKVDMPLEHLIPVELGDSDTVRVGQLAAAIGNPFGQEFTLTSGIVSAIGRTIRGNGQFSIPEVIQTDAAINPGNSGGPLIDRQGRVIGINTQIISRSGSNSGIGFAVPINIAKQVVPVLIEEGKFEYAFLGISGTSVDRNIVEARGLPEGTRGAVVITVTSGGPSDKAGLEGNTRTRRVNGIQVPVGGDIIVGVDGTDVNDMDDVIVYLVRNTRPGDTVTFDVIRGDGDLAQIDVKLGTRP